MKAISILHSDNKSTSELIQIPALEQADARSCGHYALFNAIITLSQLQINPQISPQDLSTILNDKALFENFRQTVTSFLLESVTNKSIEQGESSFEIWSQNEIERGSLERTHLAHILTTFDYTSVPFLKTQAGERSNFTEELRKRVTGLPDFSLFSLANTQFRTETNLQVREILSNIQKEKMECHAFIFGVTNHWLCLSLQRLENSFRIFLIDSCNHQVLEASEKDFEALALGARQKRISFGHDTGFLVSDFIFKMDVDRFRSTKALVWLLHDCLLGNKDWFRELFSLYIEGLISGYQRTTIALVAPQEIDTSTHQKFLKVIQWNREDFPLPVLRSHLRPLISLTNPLELVSETSLKQLKVWCAEILQILDLHLYPHHKCRTRQQSKKAKLQEGSPEVDIDCLCCCCNPVHQNNPSTRIVCDEVRQIVRDNSKKLFLLRDFFESTITFVTNQGVS